MERFAMKIGVLTSSRADYGIYLPLLEKLKKESFFKLEIIVFGSHLYSQYGLTVDSIKSDGYETIHQIYSFANDDSEKGISFSFAETAIKFAKFWSENFYDLVFCLGDRFEMCAAVQSSIPFGVKLAHLHGGETTIGAIDNIYRHQITLASQIHFVSSETFLSRVEDIIGNKKNIFNVGSLSLDGFDKINLPEWTDVRNLFGIPDKEFILITFHPETVDPNQNKIYVKIIFETLSKLCEQFHLIITLSNADTMGSLYRTYTKKLKNLKPKNITLVENFGKYNYFSAMKAAKTLVGNTSSAILESASFGKYAVNVGKRQLGRLRSKNIFDVPFNKQLIIDAVNKIVKKGLFQGENKYFKPNTATNIIKIIKNNGL